VSENEIIECTKEKPWDGVSRKGTQVRHPDAKSVETSSDYYDAYKCPWCGKYFEVELPE
jgi:transposase